MHNIHKEATHKQERKPFEIQRARSCKKKSCKAAKAAKAAKVAKAAKISCKSCKKKATNSLPPTLMVSVL
jgi:hypothetical protein